MSRHNKKQHNAVVIVAVMLAARTLVAEDDLVLDVASFQLVTFSFKDSSYLFK
ncbi:MAG: hypothetical protein GNW80_14845 [Asgard group archaeon]|nr:hypothetical protein [Asgard group archaeon]